jgi:hypothetical protein
MITPSSTNKVKKRGYDGFECRRYWGRYRYLRTESRLLGSEYQHSAMMRHKLCRTSLLPAPTTWSGTEKWPLSAELRIRIRRIHVFRPPGSGSISQRNGSGTKTYLGRDLEPKKWPLSAVLRNQIRRIYMFLGLPDPDPLVRDTDQAPDPSIIKQK